MNTTATNSLRDSCSPINPTTTLPISTLLVNEADGTSNYETGDTILRVTNGTAINFAAGEVVKVGPDFDSNVIRTTNPSANPDTITLRRQLGHGSYQTNPVASVGVTGTVSKAVVSTSDTFYNYREKNGGNCFRPSYIHSG